MHHNPSAVHDLVLMACSAAKLPHAAPALELYQGVMYGTFRANVRQVARPHVIILSAKHGFVPHDRVIEPYEQLLTPARAAEMLGNLEKHLPERYPCGIKRVMLAGGREYRRVMHAAIAHLRNAGHLSLDAQVLEVSGGIGYQRQQLGTYLRRLVASPDIVGHHPNGTPLYRTMGGFEVNQVVDVQYRAGGTRPARPARVEELFHGPVGPTAAVRMLDAKNPSCAHRWVDLRDMHSAAPACGQLPRP